MPDWTVEMTLTTGQHQAMNRSVTVENVAQRALAQIWGINECLQWAVEEGSPVPRAALDYWQQCRQNGNVQPWDVLSTLEANWGLSFSVRERTNEEHPPPPAPRMQADGAVSNGKSSAPAPAYTLNDLVGLMTKRYEFLLAEQKRISLELAAMSQIMPKPKRKYTRKVHTNGAVE